MPYKKIFVGVVVSMILVSALLALSIRPTQAQPEVEDREAIKRIDEVVKGQKLILDELAAIKEELRIVKIRVSQNQ